MITSTATEITTHYKFQAMNLFERVGVWGFALFSRGNPEDSSLPHCFDSDGALDFCLEVLGFSKVDLLRMFEAWNCARDRGACFYPLILYAFTNTGV